MLSPWIVKKQRLDFGITPLKSIAIIIGMDRQCNNYFFIQDHPTVFSTGSIYTNVAVY